jgi:hypothetical protein
MLTVISFVFSNGLGFGTSNFLSHNGLGKDALLLVFPHPTTKSREMQRRIRVLIPGD